MTATQLTDTIQAFAILTLAIGLILNSVRVRKLTQNVRSIRHRLDRCKTLTPDGHWRCHLEQGHDGRHRARRSDGLTVLWPLHPSRSRPKAS